MATAAATIDDVTTGKLPQVCAKTGGPAEATAKFRYRSTPPWTWILLLFGILPFLIARWFSGVQVLALIPFSEAALRRGKTFNRVVWGFLLLAVLLIVLGAALGALLGPAVALAGLGTAIVGLLLLVIGWPFFWPNGRVEGDWVHLSFVHRGFAQELERFYAARDPMQ